MGRGRGDKLVQWYNKLATAGAEMKALIMIKHKLYI